MVLLVENDDASVLKATMSFVDDFSVPDMEFSMLQSTDAGTCSLAFLDRVLSTNVDRQITNSAPDFSTTKQRKLTRTSKKPQKSPNRARSERSCEVRFLREKVIELEQKLCLLQQRAQNQTQYSVIDQEESQGTVSVDKARISSEVSGVWKEITSHQRHRRELTERENVRLKFMADTQRKVMANLRALLIKQSINLDRVSSRVLRLEAGIGEFRELFQHLDAAYYEVDRVFVANGLAMMENSGDDVHIRKRDDGKYLEFFSNSVFPFSQHNTAEVAWSYFKGEEKHFGNGGLYEKTVKNLDQPYTIVEDFTKELFSNNSRADIKVKQIVRRYVESDRDIVISVASVTPIQIKHKEIPGLTYHFRNYAVTRRSPLSTPEEEMSSLQLCSCISIGNGPDTLYDPRHLRSVANFFTGTIETSIQTYLERMEDALVDRSLLRKR